MKKESRIPLWAHFVGIAITFFGWMGFSYFFEGLRTKEGLASAIAGGIFFSVFMAIADGVTLLIRKSTRESSGSPRSRS
jgi:hypothetical protein